MTKLLYGLLVASLIVVVAIYMRFGKKKGSKELHTQDAEQDYSYVESLISTLCDYKTMVSKGFSQDIEKALFELTRAAENNHTDAQDFLSSMYYDASLDMAGNSVMGESAKDIRQKAFYWNTKAAERGQADALFRLAAIYQNGLGVDKDEEKAFLLLTQAAENNHKKATLLLGSMYYKAVTKTAVNNSISKQPLKDIQEKAFYWVNKAAEQGHLSALYCLGSMYMAGDGVSKNRDKAMFLFIEAAESGYLEAAATLGTIYFDQGNRDKAIFWFEKAAARNHATSMFFLGMIYMEKMQLAKADDFFAKAAKLGCKSSKDLLQKGKR